MWLSKQFPWSSSESWWMTDVLIGLALPPPSLTDGDENDLGLVWGGQTMMSASYWYPVLIPNFSTSSSASSSSACSCWFTALTSLSSFPRRPLSFCVCTRQHQPWAWRTTREFKGFSDGWMDGQVWSPGPSPPRADQTEKMGQASVGLSLITPECLNKATSARLARLLLLSKLLHLLSPPPHLLGPLFQTVERNKSYYLWPFTFLKTAIFQLWLFLIFACCYKKFQKLRRNIIRNLLDSLSSCSEVLFWEIWFSSRWQEDHYQTCCCFSQSARRVRADPGQNVGLQMKVYCFRHFYMLMLDLLGGRGQPFVLASVMNCKVKRLQAIMQLPRSSLCSEAVDNVPTHTGASFVLQPSAAHAAANICPKPQRSTTKWPRLQSVSQGGGSKDLSQLLGHQILSLQSKRCFLSALQRLSVWRRRQAKHFTVCSSVWGFLRVDRVFSATLF